MAKKDIEKLRAKSKPELLKEISILKGQFMRLRFQAETGQLNETHELTQVRKDIARVFTVIKEKDSPKVVAKAKNKKAIKGK